MTHHRDTDGSDSENESFYSAEEGKKSQVDPSREMEDEMMDWEPSTTSIFIPCPPSGKNYTIKALLCANAATFMMGIQSARILKQVMSRDTLELIMAIDTTTDNEKIDTREVLDLPLFSSKFTCETDVLSNDTMYVARLIQAIFDRGAVAMIHGGTHYITVATATGPNRYADNAVVVFSPPFSFLRSDKATLHLFATIKEASIFITNTFHTHEELALYSMHPKPPAESPYDAILSVYEGNLRLLERSMKLGDMHSDVNSEQRNISNMLRSLTAEENKTNDAAIATANLQSEIEEVQKELENVHELTNTLLYDQSQRAYAVGEWRDRGFEPAGHMKEPKDKESTWPTHLQRKDGKPQEQRKHWWQSERDESSDGTSTTDTKKKNSIGLTWAHKQKAAPSTSSKGKLTKESPQRRSRSNSHNSPFPGSSGSSGDPDDSYEEAMRLQAQFMMEDDASFQLARQFEEEERAQIAAFEALQRVEKENAPFDCPICTDPHPRGNLAKIDSCPPECAICRGCLLQHIKAQVEQARWPIFCPTCPSNSPTRGVISRWMAEIVGADDAVFEQWNRMELAGFSIAVECPKCKVSTPLDAEDFREATVLDCPVGCGAHWCKNCHREIVRKAVHSCDGEAEFKEMVKQQSGTFRPCPKCKMMIEKNGGCDNMVCTAPGCGTRFTWSSAAQ